MTSRIDAIQVALPRTVIDVQQQQHAAARQPVVAQDQAAAQLRGEVRAREIRPEELQRSAGRRVREEGIEGVDERDARQQEYARERQHGRARRPAGSQGAPPNQVGLGALAADGAAPVPPPPLAGVPSADGKGRRVDLKL